jgi:hypothetical protein
VLGVKYCKYQKHLVILTSFEHNVFAESGSSYDRSTIDLFVSNNETGIPEFPELQADALADTEPIGVSHQTPDWSSSRWQCNI